MNAFKKALPLIIVVLIGCSGSKEAATEKMALGPVKESELISADYEPFKATFDTVHVDQMVVDMIGQVKGDVDVQVFFGSWCKDSKREVPRFLKVASKAGISDEKIKLYGVDRTKKSPDGLTEKYNIQLVPTFIFLKNGEEIGRITETPHTTIEGDMIQILAGAQKK